MQKLAGLDKHSTGSGGSGLAARDRAAADAAVLSAGLGGGNSRSVLFQQPPAGMPAAAGAAGAGDSGDDEDLLNEFHRSGKGASSCTRTRAKGLFGIPMLPATHNFMLVWAVLMLAVDILYTAILLPIVAAFEFNQPGEPMFWVSAWADCCGCCFRPPALLAWLALVALLAWLDQGDQTCSRHPTCFLLV
jgi:hypothetical protein